MNRFLGAAKQLLKGFLIANPVTQFVQDLEENKQDPNHKGEGSASNSRMIGFLAGGITWFVAIAFVISVILEALGYPAMEAFSNGLKSLRWFIFFNK